MTIQGGSSPACAACKYQRKKCSSQCILSPYFPANQPQVFQNVHRLFGVSNITKTLKMLQTDEQKEDAMKAIRYESDIRKRYPVHGCLIIISELRKQLQQAFEELQSVHAQLAICKEQQINHFRDLSVSQHPSGSNEIPFLMNNYLPNGNYVSDFTELSLDNQAKPLFEVDTYCDDLMRNNSSDASRIHQERDHVSEEYNDMFINTMADDRQSFVETKEASDSSSESSLKNTIQSSKQVSKSELRSAAACFSLTSVN